MLNSSSAAAGKTTYEKMVGRRAEGSKYRNSKSWLQKYWRTNLKCSVHLSAINAIIVLLLSHVSQKCLQAPGILFATGAPLQGRKLVHHRNHYCQKRQAVVYENIIHWTSDLTTSEHFQAKSANNTTPNTAAGGLTLSRILHSS